MLGGSGSVKHNRVAVPIVGRRFCMYLLAFYRLAPGSIPKNTRFLSSLFLCTLTHAFHRFKFRCLLPRAFQFSSQSHPAPVFCAVGVAAWVIQNFSKVCQTASSPHPRGI